MCVCLCWIVCVLFLALPLRLLCQSMSDLLPFSFFAVRLCPTGSALPCFCVSSVRLCPIRSLSPCLLSDCIRSPSVCVRFALCLLLCGPSVSDWPLYPCFCVPLCLSILFCLSRFVSFRFGFIIVFFVSFRFVSGFLILVSFRFVSFSFILVSFRFVFVFEISFFVYRFVLQLPGKP